MRATDLPWARFLSCPAVAVGVAGRARAGCDLKRGHDGPHAMDYGAETWLWSEHVEGLALFGGTITTFDHADQGDGGAR